MNFPKVVMHEVDSNGVVSDAPEPKEDLTQLLRHLKCMTTVAEHLSQRILLTPPENIMF